MYDKMNGMGGTHYEVFFVKKILQDMEKYVAITKHCITFSKRFKMKHFLMSMSVAFLSFYGNARENYTASTPADRVVRIFLGISLTDSIDFIRWQISLDGNHYSMNCNYGIGRPNTSGFINGGKRVTPNGRLETEGHYLKFYNGDKIIKALVLTKSLLHLVYENDKLLVGNGGWSYTLNNTISEPAANINITPGITVLKDSMVFVGRTPCGIPGIVSPEQECYKLKWHIALYADTKKNEPTSFKIFSIQWRKPNGKTGYWKMIKEQDGRVIYNLYDENGKPLISLLKVNEDILLFTSKEGQLLTGNEDFSYTLNKL